MADPALSAPDSLARSQWRAALPRLGALSLVLTTGLTVAPVVGGHQAAAPHPVRPGVTQFQVAQLTVTRTSAGSSVTRTPQARQSQQVSTASGHGSLVGVTWPSTNAPANGTVVTVRGLATSGGWTPWTETEVTSDVDPAAVAAGQATRIGTEPIWLGPVTKVQIRYADADAPVLRRGRVELVEPGTSNADAPARLPAGSATAATARPSIISRAGWGADESLRTCPPALASTTLAMAVHHTAGSNTYTAAQSASIIRGIYAYHVKGQGWCDIGYNALVDKYGQTFEGRAGGLDLPIIGAHTGGFNTDTFGVSVLGTYTSVAPSAAAMTALTNVLAWREASFYRNATSTSVLTSRSSESRYPEGTRVTVPFIYGHRDLSPTSCPGTNLYGKLGTIRSTVQSKTSFTSSVLYKRWAAMGGATGTLGPVLKGEGPVSFGLRTVFQRGWAMYAVGSSTRLVGPGLDGLYWRSGGPAAWGYPLADELPITKGTSVRFQDGHLAVWSLGTGPQPLFGAIRDYWLAPGAGTSPLGYPRSAEKANSSGGVEQVFEVGNAYYKAGIGTHAVNGVLLRTYLTAGGPSGRYGYPVGEQRAVAGGTAQTFQGGTITIKGSNVPPYRNHGGVVVRPR